jgi:hypothetical protein
MKSRSSRPISTRTKGMRAGLAAALLLATCVASTARNLECSSEGTGKLTCAYCNCDLRGKSAVLKASTRPT